MADSKSDDAPARKARETPASGKPVQLLRTPLQVTRSVWKALLLRESLTRLFSSRAAWFWLLMEPAAHVAYLMVIFTVIRVKHVGGLETAAWIMIGLLSFFAFRRTAFQCMNAVGSNRALFTYRQVKPVDTVLTRSILEGALVVVVSSTLILGSAFFGVDSLPDDPLAALAVFFGMWLLGLGFGLTTSVAVELLPEVGRVIGLVITPLYFASGVIYPIGSVPPPYRAWIMLNPLAHGIDAARKSFAERYHAAPEVSIAYIYGFALALLFLGLALHQRFSRKLVTQ